MIKRIILFILITGSLVGYGQDSTKAPRHVFGIEVMSSKEFSFNDFRTLGIIDQDQYILNKSWAQYFFGMGYMFHHYFKDDRIPRVSAHVGVSRLLRFRPYYILTKSPLNPTESLPPDIYVGDITAGLTWMPKRDPLFTLFKMGYTWDLRLSTKLDKYFGDAPNLNASPVIPSAQFGASIVFMYKIRPTESYRYAPLTFRYTLSELDLNTFSIATVIPIITRS